MPTERQKKESTIVFHIGEETKPIILNQNDYKQSLFVTQIGTAHKLIGQKMQVRVKQTNKDDGFSKFNDIYDNNIISFIGERGSGKSSCMYSVINILAENDDDKDFAFLDTLDPSFFDESHNILQLIIGKMYARFTKDIEKDKQKDEDHVYRLVTLFQQTKSHLKFLDLKPQYMEDNELEELSHLSAGVDLRNCLRKLVDSYLGFINAKMLIVTVDDIDLNTKQAYDMAEQIRKFLILPNVIILMAVKLDQLTNVVKLKLTEEYRALLDKERMPDDVIMEMADRYIKKLLPLESRIYMPTFDIYIEQPLKIECEGQEAVSYKSAKMAVPELIFRKCRYLFYNTRGTTSLIVPRNLRDLRLLVSMLYRMPDYIGNDVNENAKRSDESNKNSFKKYFFNDWLNLLSNTSKSIAQKLIAISEPTQLNKSVIQELKKQYGLKETSANNDVNGWSVILQDNTVNYNLSLGDAFAVMDYIRRVNADTDSQRLIFFIKSLYSIRLYEYYDQQTADINAYDQTKDPKEEKKKDEEPNRRDDFLENISNYRKLIGGSLYNIGGKTLLPPEGQGGDEEGGNSREFLFINKKPLTDAISHLKSTVNTIDEKSADEMEELTKKLQMAEFFMLTISRYQLTKSGTQAAEQKNFTFRERMEAYYDRSLQMVQNVVFDVTAPFFTLLDVRHSYGRFDDKIFEIARNWNYQRSVNIDGEEKLKSYQSLYIKMLEKADKKIGRKPEHDLLSSAGMRNAEVVEDMLEYLKGFRYSYRPGTKGLQGILAEFYKNVAKYEIATYDKWDNVDDKNEKDKYYTIKFMPFKVFAELLQASDNPLFDMIFKMGDYSSEDVQPSFDYIDRDMGTEDIVKLLSEHIPEINDEKYTNKLKRHYFKSERLYAKETIISRLQDLSQKPTWAVLRINTGKEMDEQGE